MNVITMSDSEALDLLGSWDCYIYCFAIMSKEMH